jgi:signal transduction histidine kinase
LRLKEAQQTRGIQEAAKAIVRAVGTQGRIIDDLMDLSRLRTGKLTLAASRINLCAKRYCAHHQRASGPVGVGHAALGSTACAPAMPSKPCNRAATAPRAASSA